jgi:hypothetical protein
MKRGAVGKKMMVNICITGNGIDASKLTNAFLECGSVYGLLRKFVLKA